MAGTSAKVFVCACAWVVVAALAACGSGGKTPPACPIYDIPLPDTAPPADPGEAQVPDDDGDAWRDADRDGEDPGPADPQPGEPSDAPPEAPQPGEFGAPCLANSDCASGFCIESPTGYACTRTCVEDCPAGWFCRSMLIGSDVVPLCVPEGVELCKPCKFDTQCGTGICMTVGDGTYCGRDCSANACPTGYDCVEVPLGAGRGSTKQCKPVSNACDCLVVSHGIERPCVRQNDVGRCLGIEHCDKDLGWVGCTAVEAKPEECNAADDDCDGTTDETFANKGTACFAGAGECYRTGVFVCRSNGTGTECNAPVVAGTTEACNGKDDDCDGATDEPFANKGTACSAGTGECYRTGVFACRADGTGTECNAPVAAGAAETCNGKDDNCNGTTDETFTNKGTSCFAGIGECYRTGVFVCRADGTATECNAPVVAGVTETCNAKDDDCDGSTDETWTNKGTSCFTGQGECYRTGVFVCRADGTNTQCNAPAVSGTTETCNAKDDDCDGSTDETWTNKGAACFTGQ
ncbi:MAG: hypothetical protein FJ087_23455, partial [Deltaproteobacteria bacterium]|nr:hypothetical protein [Deltaproteobacteria bacterium]